MLEKQEAIEEKADDHDRDLTEKEQERYDALEEQIETLQGEKGEIETALDYLREYYVDE